MRHITLSNQKHTLYIALEHQSTENNTCTILSHISLAVGLLPSDNPKHGNTVTLTFWVSHAATAKVTGGFPFAVLQHMHSS